MPGQNAYESCCMQEILGDTLRPGGLILTDIAVKSCALAKKSSILDVGCGRGMTVNHLKEKYGFSAVGLDPSEKLISDARENYGKSAFFNGRGEELPFEAESFDCVFAECTLSLMNQEKAIMQVQRVLKNGGWFVINDVYAKNPEAANKMSNFTVNSCMRGMHDLEKLRKLLEMNGFLVESCEDYSQYLKELLVKIIFSNNSMCEFWSMASGGCVNGEEFYSLIKQCKPGYFMLIARKEKAENG